MAKAVWVVVGMGFLSLVATVVLGVVSPYLVGPWGRGAVLMALCGVPVVGLLVVELGWWGLGMGAEKAAQSVGNKGRRAARLAMIASLVAMFLLDGRSRAVAAAERVRADTMAQAQVLRIAQAGKSHGKFWPDSLEVLLRRKELAISDLAESCRAKVEKMLKEPEGAAGLEMRIEDAMGVRYSGAGVEVGADPRIMVLHNVVPDEDGVGVVVFADGATRLMHLASARGVWEEDQKARAEVRRGTATR